MRNQVLEKFEKGVPCVGTFVHILYAASVTALGQTGLDYVIIDNEHGPVGLETATGLIETAKGAGLCPFVRINAIDRGQILKMLDAGAMGLVIPQIHTPDEVAEVVSYAKFAPLGNRGYCPSADGGWGYGPEYAAGMEGYMEEANAQTLVIPQCETAECLDHIEEIVSMEGVGGIFIGPYDLSIALGIPGQFDNPVHLEAVEKVRKACESAGKLCIIYCDNGEKGAAYIRQGFQNVTVGLDMISLITAVKAAVDTVRG